VRVPALVAFVSALGIAAAASAQTPVPTPKPTPWAAGSAEIAVNEFTVEDQDRPAIASSGSGDSFIAAWSSAGQDGDQGAIIARRYNRFALPLGPEFVVNTYTTGNQESPAIGADYFGDFVVVWSGPDGAGGTDVFARRFAQDGTPLSGDFQVNTYTSGNQREARVHQSDHGFLVVWSSSPVASEPPQDGDLGGIYAQLFDADGNPVGGEFRVNTTTVGDQRNPSVSGDCCGSRVVVWESDGQDGDSAGIFGQRYDSTGAPIGSEFQVNTYTTGYQVYPDVAGWAGQFVVVWTSQDQDGSEGGIFGRTFSQGIGGTEFRVNAHTELTQTHARVSIDPGLGFTVVWEGYGQDDPTDPGSSGVFAQRFANAPFPTSAFGLVQPHVGGEYGVNIETGGMQALPAISQGVAGSFVIAWVGSAQDGDGKGVFARRFSTPMAIRLGVDETPSGGTSDVNGVLESGERVVISPHWWNNVSGQMTLSGTALEFVGPPGPSYSIDDATADYGTIFAGATVDCHSTTGDCFEVTVSGPRPSAHWDAAFDEASMVQGFPVPQRKTWALHVGGSFGDVPNDAFYPYIENIFHNGITAGGGCGAGLYCGEDDVLRQQMAVFLVKAARGPGFTPAPATGTVFDDVPASSPFAPWIEELARMGVTSGCTAPPPPALPSYCPTAVVNRQQMAAFLLKSVYGPSYGGGGICNGIFADVPCSNPFVYLIEALYGLGITGGCQTNPLLYCPTNSTKRKQMAAFLVKTFGLQLYGPD
jgi:hypothetical protein